ncbi:MAG: hypothetical protein KGI64_02140 [Xanthomonadaceae bacterium]|nr:hypothetical protein [Xanthomonadaceae bacterium]MDE2083643.1 hypothetical protein [Xanthomonadaceae bacterium]
MTKLHLLSAATTAAGLMVSSLAWAQVAPPPASVPAISIWGIALLGFLVVAIGLRFVFSRRG